MNTKQQAKKGETTKYLIAISFYALVVSVVVGFLYVLITIVKGEK